MDKYLESLLADKNIFLKLIQESLLLKIESQNQVQAKRYAYQELIRVLINQDMHEGVFRKVNSLLAARLLINSIVSEEYGSRSTRTPQDVSKDTLVIFCSSIEVC